MQIAEKKAVVIIGAGLAGLGAALKLLENGFACTVLEAQTQPGGLANNFKIQNKYFPLGYHHILSGDKPLLATLKKLGLYELVVWKKGRVCFALNGALYDLAKPLDFIRFPMPLLDKLRFVKLMLYCFLKKNWNKDMGNARDWLDKMAGAGVRKTIFDPLMDIKYGLPSENLSANWLGSRLHYQEFSKPLGYIPDTDWTQLLVQRLEQRITKLGGKIITQALVKKLIIQNNVLKEILFSIAGQDYHWPVEIIINTAPPPVFKKFFDYQEDKMNRIEYLDALSLIMEIEEKLPKDFYLLSCLKPRFSFGGIFLLSALNQTLGVKNKTVINFFTTLSSRYEHLRNKSAEELLEIYLDDFQKIFKFKPKPIWYRLNLIADYSPKFLKNYENMDVRSKIPGLYFAGNYLTYPTITSTGSALASGTKAAQYVLEDYD